MRWRSGGPSRWTAESPIDPLSAPTFGFALASGSASSVPPLSVPRFRSPRFGPPASGLRSFGPGLRFRRASCRDPAKRAPRVQEPCRKRRKVAPQPSSPVASASRHIGSGLLGCSPIPTGRRWPELGAKTRVVAMCVTGQHLSPPGHLFAARCDPWLPKHHGTTWGNSATWL